MSPLPSERAKIGLEFSFFSISDRSFKVFLLRKESLFLSFNQVGFGIDFSKSFHLFSY